MWARHSSLPHYDLMRRVHREGESDAEADWESRPWEGDPKRAFTKAMLDKVRTMIPTFWR